MEKNENCEAGDTDPTEGRIHSFHRVYTVTFLKDLVEDSPKFSLGSGALRARSEDEARCKTGHFTLILLSSGVKILHSRLN